MSMRVNFFATRCDLLDLLTEVEAGLHVHYCQGGLFDAPRVVEYKHAGDIPDLGFTAEDASIKGTSFLIARQTTVFILREIRQRTGGTRYAIDQLWNPDTVAFAPGGLFDDRTLMAGTFGTCSSCPQSLGLLRLFRKAVRRRWSKIRSYFAGPEAEKILDAGGRLTTDVRAPLEYDLRRP